MLRGYPLLHHLADAGIFIKTQKGVFEYSWVLTNIAQKTKKVPLKTAQLLEYSPHYLSSRLKKLLKYNNSPSRVSAGQSQLVTPPIARLKIRVYGVWKSSV